MRVYTTVPDVVLGCVDAEIIDRFDMADEWYLVRLVGLPADSRGEYMTDSVAGDDLGPIVFDEA